MSGSKQTRAALVMDGTRVRSDSGRAHHIVYITMRAFPLAQFFQSRQ